MTRILHIQTHTATELSSNVIEQQRKDSDIAEIRVVDLRADNPDYDKLVDMVFESDTIQVW